MTEQTDISKLLLQIEKNTHRQLVCSRIQCLFSLLAVLFCAGVLFLLISLMPQIEQISAELETVLGNLETVTAQLAALDIGEIVHSAEGDLRGMVENVDSLVSTSQAGISETLQKLASIDFDGLNRAIADFSAVVQKLSGFLKVFG